MAAGVTTSICHRALKAGPELFRTPNANEIGSSNFHRLVDFKMIVAAAELSIDDLLQLCARHQGICAWAGGYRYRRTTWIEDGDDLKNEDEREKFMWLHLNLQLAKIVGPGVTLASLVK